MQNAPTAIRPSARRMGFSNAHQYAFTRSRPRNYEPAADSGATLRNGQPISHQGTLDQTVNALDVCVGVAALKTSLEYGVPRRTRPIDTCQPWPFSSLSLRGRRGYNFKFSGSRVHLRGMISRHEYRRRVVASRAVLSV